MLIPRLFGMGNNMSEPDIKLIHADPGFLAYYTLDELTRRGKDADSNEWGICEAENYFWLGKRAIQSGEDVLRLPLREILEKRSEMFPGLADEKVYIFAGIDNESGKFAWFLMNEESALSCIASESTEQNVTPLKGSVIHQVLLADLICLADLWDVPDECLAVEIDSAGNLVPKVIDESEEKLLSLARIADVIEEKIPGWDEMDLVLEYRAVDDGSELEISTMDYVCSPDGKERKSRWWSFTDTYKELMDS